MYQTLGHSKQYIRTEIRYETYPVSQTTQSTMGRIRVIRYDFFKRNLGVVKSASSILNSGFLFAYTSLHINAVTSPGVV